NGTWRCRDGDVEIQVITEPHWHGFLELVGRPSQFSAPEWTAMFYRGEHRAELAPFVEAWMAERSKQEGAARAQALHVPSSPINTLGDFFRDEQARSRGFFVPFAHPSLGLVEVAGAPYLLSEAVWKIERPAPALGEHGAEILAREARKDAGDPRGT